MNQNDPTCSSCDYIPGGGNSSIAQGKYTDTEPYRSTRFNRSGKQLFSAGRESIKKKLSFLQPCQESIHSMVIVGSVAYNAQTTNSDIDVVIITTREGHEKVCSVVFEKEIDESLSGKETTNFEYTVLSSAHVEELFQISSPFAYSIRHGVVIQDDGFLLVLRNNKYPALPQEKYYTTCLYENIATPYFGLLKKFQKETKRKGCTLSCPKKSQGCKGLPSAQLFARLVMQMLYITLPARGLMPLTKSDVIPYAKMAYGSRGEAAARNIVSLMQEKRSCLCFDEFKMLREFAVQQYKEILNIAGLSRKVRDIITDAAKIARKDFQSINNPSLKNCVI